MVDIALGLLKRFWWAIPLLALSIALLATRGTLADAKKDLRLEKQAHAETVANYRAAAAERKASDLVNVERVSTEGTTISKETLDDYTQRIAALRADFAERVRRATQANPSGASGANLPGISQAAAGVDEAACETQFPAEDALVASEQAEQLVALQRWVTKVGSIDTNGN